MRCANTCTTREQGILESLLSGGRLERNVTTLALHRINEDSAGNNHLLDEEYSRGMGFRWELPAHKRGIHTRKGISQGITSLFMRIQAGKIKMRGKSFEM
jgi:hypothetical protein